MKKLLALCAALLMALTVAACTTDEQALRDSSSLLLSAREVKDVFVGNTVTSADGKVYYFDRSGVVVGKGAYGDKIKANWNITPRGSSASATGTAAMPPAPATRSFSTTSASSASWWMPTATCNTRSLTS